MGVAFFVAALLAQAPLEVTGPPVESVELRLAVGSDPALARGLREWVVVRPGQKLSRTLVRRSIERLMESGRFADVVVLSEAGAKGVRVVFELAPRERVQTTYVDGNKVLSDNEVLEACGLVENDEIYPERIAQAIEALKVAYAKRGYFQTQASLVVERNADGLSLTIDVREGEPTQFASLSISGDPGLPVDALEREVGLELGAVLSTAVLDEGVNRLRSSLRTKGFLRARVDPSLVRVGGQVLLSVLAGPRLTLELQGNTHFNGGYLKQVIAYDDTESLDAELLNRLARRLERFYRFKGYHDVKVEALEMPGSRPRTVVAVLKISEGLPVTVSRVHFDGNERITDEALNAVLRDVLLGQAPVVDNEQRLKDPLALEGRTLPGRFDAVPAPEPQTVWVEAAWRDAALAMTAHYQDRGFLKAQVTLARFELEGQTGVVTFSVNEGEQTTVGEVLLSGVPEGLKVSHGIAVNEPFSERSVEQAQRNINRDLRQHGYLFNRVEASARLVDATGARIEVTVIPGPKVTVGKVFIRGQTRTTESTIRRQLEFAEGETFNPDTLAQTQRKLLALGPFRDVDIRLLSPDLVESAKDVVVEVKEATRYVLEGGLGYYLADGPRGFLDLLIPNVFGRAINFAAHGQVNFIGASGPAFFGQFEELLQRPAYQLLGGRGNVSVQNRGLLPADIGMRLDLVGERLFRPSYEFSRAAVVPGLDWSETLARAWAPLKLTLQLQYEVEAVEVRSVSSLQGLAAEGRADEGRLRFGFGLFNLHTARLGSTLDMRDDPSNPTKGFVLQVAAEHTAALYGELYSPAPKPGEAPKPNIPIQVQFFKLYGSATGYIPTGPSLVWALSLRGGSIWPLRDDSVTPAVKRFFMGGSTTLRGFREDGVVAEDQRRALAQTRRDCEPLASTAGCTDKARALLDGREVPSEGGELFFLGKAELRIKAVGQLQLGLFFEAGNLWLERPQWPLVLRTTAGAGLRYGTPIGPLAFDLGFNLRPDVLLNEPLANFHFSIGLF